SPITSTSPRISPLKRPSIRTRPSNDSLPAYSVPRPSRALSSTRSSSSADAVGSPFIRFPRLFVPGPWRFGLAHPFRGEGGRALRERPLWPSTYVLPGVFHKTPP